MNQDKITKFITKLRKERNLTQQQFANIIGVTNSAVSKWESGKCLPDPTLYPTIADYFNISVSEIIAGKREKDKKSNNLIYFIIISFLIITNLLSLVCYFQKENTISKAYKMRVSTDDIKLIGFLIHNQEQSYIIINDLLITTPNTGTINNIKNLKVYLKDSKNEILKIENNGEGNDLTKNYSSDLLKIDNIDLENLSVEYNYYDGLKNINGSSKINLTSINDNP